MAYDLTVSDRVAKTFWSKVDVREREECWLWRGKAFHGYGRFKLRGIPRNACHISLAVDGRPRPAAPNDFALHGDTCVRGCVNPAHLRWGSHTENMADRKRLGRHVFCGARAGRILSEADVIAIRASIETAKVLAATHGVAVRTIRAVRARQIWKHVL